MDGGEYKGLKRKSFNQGVGAQLGGKMPPQARDVEQAVLGALMIDKDCISDVSDILKPEAFYSDAHQHIYEAIMKLFGDTQPIDILTVTQALKQQGNLEMVGGPAYISQLTNRVASAANAEFHARIITQKYIAREIIRISSAMLEKAYDETNDVFDVLDSAEKSLFDISEGNIKKNYDSMDHLLDQAIKQIEEASKKADGLSGIPSGFTDLDRITSGWQPSDLIILAGRPGMGKTAFVLSMARNIAVQFNIGIAIFSLEMSALQLVNRLIASETGIESEKIRRGKLADHEYQQLHAKIGPLAEAPIFIDDTAALTIVELRAKARRLVSQHGVKIIIIDYLQLMTGSGEHNGNRVNEVSMLSRSLKIIAKELNIPIICLSQLSRSVETRGGDKKPILSDLRESGSIEQDADIVSFVYRPEYYGMELDSDNEPTAGRGQILIEKHRNGSTGTVKLKFIGSLIKFDNLDSFGSESAPLMPNNDFESGNDGGFVTKSSKMNLSNFDDEDEDDFDMPFDSNPGNFDGSGF